MSILRLKPSVCRILAGESCGTGYLVAADLVATCKHLVEGVEVGIRLTFPSGEFEGRVCQRHRDADVALIKLTARCPATPLGLGSDPPEQSNWEGYGFPAAALGDGMPLDGRVVDPSHSAETSVMLLRCDQAAAGVSTPVHGWSGSPIYVGGLVVGHFTSFYADPDSVGLRARLLRRPPRAAYGAILATHAARVDELLMRETGAAAPSARPVDAPTTPEQKALALSERADDLIAYGKVCQATGSAPEEVAYIAELIIACGQPQAALDLLQKLPDSLRRRQLEALALARDGQAQAALEILEELQRQGMLDAETSGMLAGRYKRLWQQQPDCRDYLFHSYYLYLQAYTLHHSSYTGVNAAFLAFTNPGVFRSDGQELAQQIVAELETLPAAARTHWEWATMGEASLLTGQDQAACDYYRQAVAASPGLHQDHDVMHEQAKRILRHRDWPDDLLDDIFIGSAPV